MKNRWIWSKTTRNHYVWDQRQCHL